MDTQNVAKNLQNHIKLLTTESSSNYDTHPLDTNIVHTDTQNQSSQDTHTTTLIHS